MIAIRALVLYVPVIAIQALVLYVPVIAIRTLFLYAHSLKPRPRRFPDARWAAAPQPSQNRYLTEVQSVLPVRGRCRPADCLRARLRVRCSHQPVAWAPFGTVWAALQTARPSFLPWPVADGSEPIARRKQEATAVRLAPEWPSRSARGCRPAEPRWPGEPAAHRRMKAIRQARQSPDGYACQETIFSSAKRAHRPSTGSIPPQSMHIADIPSLATSPKTLCHRVFFAVF